MGSLTAEDVEAAFVKALRSNAGVTSLLGDGNKGVGAGNMIAGAKYPYILVEHWVTDMTRVMGYKEAYSNTVVNIQVIAIDTDSKPAKSAISGVHKAIISCLDADNSLTISGRNMSRPVYCRADGVKSQLISDRQVIYWSDTKWEVFSTPS